MPETDQWGELGAGDIARRLAAMAIASRLGWGPGRVVSLVLLGGHDEEAVKAFREIRIELAHLRERMDRAMMQVREIAQQIHWLQLVLEAEPAADRIMTKFEVLLQLDLHHQRLARQLVKNVLDPNQGVMVDLATLHAVITGMNPIDPGQVSLVELWMQKVRDNASLVQGVAWVNSYFTCLAQIQLRGVFLLINALLAEDNEALAREVVRTVSDWIRQQLALLRVIDLSFARDMPIHRDRQVNFVYDGMPFCGDEQHTLVGLPEVFATSNLNHSSFGAISNQPQIEAVALADVHHDPLGVNVASFRGMFFAAGYSSDPVGYPAAIITRAQGGDWQRRLTLRASPSSLPVPMLAHNDRFYVAVGGAIAVTDDGEHWRTVNIPYLRPVHLFAHGGQIWVAWIHEDQTLSFAPFPHGAPEHLDLARRAHHRGVVSTFPTRGLKCAVFGDCFCLVTAQNLRARTEFLPLAAIAAGGTLPDFQAAIIQIPNPGHARNLGFSGVLGSGQAFELALFTGMNADYVEQSDYLLKISTVTKLWHR